VLALLDDDELDTGGDDDDAQLERLLRYALRPPFAARRLSWTHDGKLRLLLRKPWHTGQRDIIFEPARAPQAPRRGDPQAPPAPDPLPRHHPRRRAHPASRC
jgi:hypothetical protein